MPTRPTTAAQKADAQRLRGLYETWRDAQQAKTGRRPSQEEVADLLKIGQSALAQRLSGKLAMNSKFAANVARLLGCEVRQFSEALASEIAGLGGSLPGPAEVPIPTKDADDLGELVGGFAAALARVKPQTRRAVLSVLETLVDEPEDVEAVAGQVAALLTAAQKRAA